MRELAARREILANAYSEGFEKGQEAAEAAQHPPALLQAAKNWRHMILAQLRAQTEEEKTLQARNEEEKARRVSLAMRAADAAEPAAWRAWKKMGMEAYEKDAEAKVALAVRARQALQQKHERETEQLAMRQEEKTEPAAWKKWDNKPDTARKQALIMTAEEQTEPAAYKEWEQKRAAEVRLQAMHAAMRRDYSNQMSQLDEDRQQAIDDAAKLFEFCGQEFPTSAELRQFCFEKLSSPPHTAVDLPVLTQSQEAYSAPTLEGAMLKAEIHGNNGVPEYAIFHPANGPAEAFKLDPVEPGSKVPANAIGFLNVNIPQGTSLAALRAERAENEAERQVSMLRERAMIKERENMLANADARHEEISVNGPTLQVC